MTEREEVLKKLAEHHGYPEWCTHVYFDKSQIELSNFPEMGYAHSAPKTYWDYVFTIAEIQAAKQSLSLNIETKDEPDVTAIETAQIGIIENTDSVFNGIVVQILGKPPIDKDFKLPNGVWHEAVNDDSSIIKCLHGKFPNALGDGKYGVGKRSRIRLLTDKELKMLQADDQENPGHCTLIGIDPSENCTSQERMLISDIDGKPGRYAITGRKETIVGKTHHLEYWFKGRLVMRGSFEEKPQEVDYSDLYRANSMVEL